MPGGTAAGTVQHHQYETPSQHQALSAARIYDPTWRRPPEQAWCHPTATSASAPISA